MLTARKAMSMTASGARPKIGVSGPAGCDQMRSEIRGTLLFFVRTAKAVSITSDNPRRNWTMSTGKGREKSPGKCKRTCDEAVDGAGVLTLTLTLAGDVPFVGPLPDGTVQVAPEGAPEQVNERFPGTPPVG